MTPVEEIREAAQLMRERAGGTHPSPWYVDTESSQRTAVRSREGVPPPRNVGGRPSRHVAYTSGSHREGLADAHHIASWSPQVARAIADLLDIVAKYDDSPDPVMNHALIAARAYLGGAT